MGIDKRNLIGTLSELLVALDLIEKEYEVFQSIDGKGSCDFLIMKGKELFRVEVKTKTYSVLPESKEILRMRAKSDILAVVVNKQIYYYPPVP